MASALSWLYGPSTAHTPTATLQEMQPHHRSAWQRLLGAASSFHDALRSESDEALRTGGQSLELLLKRPINEYNLKSTYVPIQADLIAEPSSPKGVDMLSVLPPSLANFYSSEANVLCQDVDANRRAVLRRLGEKVGGPFSEYLRYLNRPDIFPFWDFLPPDEVKGMCAFKCVMKSDGVHLRKILATLEKNFLFCEVPREQDLGLWAGATLGALILSTDEAHSAAFDQEACFSYVEVPAWWKSYQCTAPVRHWQVGGSARTGLLCLSDDALVYPAYRRLPMGSKHSVDIIIQINWFQAGQSMVSSQKLHMNTVLSAAHIEILKHPQPGFGFVLELFAGSARWAAALGNKGWGVLTPIEIEEDSRLDLTNAFFLEKIMLLIAAYLVALIHSGTPCSSLSQAITPAWRSLEYPLGLPDLSGRALAKVREGNLLTEIAMRILSFAASKGVGVSDENPWQSFHWALPCVITACKPEGPLAFNTLTDYCPFHTTWKKRTRIRGNREWLQDFGRLCSCKHEHEMLRGSTVIATAGGAVTVSKTSLASPYPFALVEAWAQASLKDSAAGNWQSSDRHLWDSQDPTEQSQCKPGLTPLPGVCLNHAGLGPSRFLLPHQVARYSHIDDHITIGSSPALVKATADMWSQRLILAGFVIKDDIVVQDQRRYIGLATQTTPARLKLPTLLMIRLHKSLSVILSWDFVLVEVLHSIQGILVWVFLQHRSCLSILFRVFKVTEQYSPKTKIPVDWVRQELQHALHLLPLVYADLHRLILPLMMAQDAEGSSGPDAVGHGGWGLGVSFPDRDLLSALVLRHLNTTVPKEFNLAQVSQDPCGALTASQADIPNELTSNTLWYDLIARAHSYFEHVHLYEGRVLLRSLEIVCKIPETQRSRLMSLEDNQTVHFSFAHGRSPVFSLNQLCRRRLALELASDVHLMTAWCPTKRMPMDTLSRDRVVMADPHKGSDQHP